MPYWRVPEDDKNDMYEYFMEKRNNWGRNDVWMRTWTLAHSILGVQYTYQKGYYYFYLGRYAGKAVAEAAIFI